MQKKWKLIVLFFIGMTTAVSAEEPSAPRAKALGFTVDFLPTVMSLTEGKAGGALQTWFGYGHFRARLVGAHLHYNDALVGNDDFKNHSMTVGALIADYVFGDHFSGPWIGTGYEFWSNAIENKASGRVSHWNNHVLTLGGGYIFPIKGNFYLEPWGAAHLILNEKKINSDGAAFKPQRFSAEASLKAGYFFDL